MKRATSTSQRKRPRTLLVLVVLIRMVFLWLLGHAVRLGFEARLSDATIVSHRNFPLSCLALIMFFPLLFCSPLQYLTTFLGVATSVSVLPPILRSVLPENVVNAPVSAPLDTVLAKAFPEVRLSWQGDTQSLNRALQYTDGLMYIHHGLGLAFEIR